MRLLYFKGIYREPILRGDKRDTIRRAKGAPKPGQMVRACVGPSRPFADLEVMAVDIIDTLPLWRRQQVEECYGAIEPGMVRLLFAVRSTIAPGQPAP